MIIESLEDIEMPLFEINNERMSDVIKFQKQKLYRSLMDEFIKSFPGLFLDGVFCFDGFATLYSIVPVGFSPKTRKLSRIKSETIMKEKCQILLHIKPSAGHSFNLKDDIDEGKQFLKALILNSALQDPEKLPYYDNQKIYCFNNAQINFSGFPSLGKVQKLHYGIVPEIVFAEDFTVVAFDTIKDIFYKPINLYKLCCGYFTFEKTVTLPLQMYDILEEFLNGMICLPNFGENKNIPIILCGHNSSRADEVLMMHENLVISLTRYYKIIYEYDIKQRYWPLAVSVINGKRSYFPLECLTVAPGQKAEISNLAPEKLKLFEEVCGPFLF
uniref:Uncharacterized protein n=1 Tax=Panagrolaimus davidi TaxID=227884 RepID=A0A914P7Y0_9BILA